MICQTCHCILDNKNIAVAALDFGAADDDDMKYYCSAKCLIEWIMGFAVLRFGVEEAKEMLLNSE